MCNSGDEAFWTAFLRHLRERGLAGGAAGDQRCPCRHQEGDRPLLPGLRLASHREVRFVQTSCRVHFARNLLVKVPKASQDMVADALRSVFVQQNEPAVEQQWDQVITMFTEKFPAAATLMAEAREDVLAFRSFPAEHWRKIWSTNPLERLNKEIRRRTRVVGIFPNDAAIIRLVGALLLEQQEEWQLEGRRVFSEQSMAKLDSSNDPDQDQRSAALAAAA